MEQQTNINNNNFNELTQKIAYLEEQLKSELFSNPIREIQENLRSQLLDFSQTFYKNLNVAEEYIVHIYIKKFEQAKLEEKKATEAPNSTQTLENQNNFQSEELVSKKLLEKKEYQCEILKNAFYDYEKKTVNKNINT